MTKEKEFEAFLSEYKHGEIIDEQTFSPQGNGATLYKNKNGTVDIQFCGWCITLSPNGTYFFNDTTGG